jgi:hypothetical protein
MDVGRGGLRGGRGRIPLTTPVTLCFEVPRAGPTARVVARATRGWLAFGLLVGWACAPVLMTLSILIPLSGGMGDLVLRGLFWLLAALVAGACWFMARLSPVMVASFTGVEFYGEQRPPVLRFVRGRRSRVRPLSDLRAIDVRYFGSGGSSQYDGWETDRRWYPYLVLTFRRSFRGRVRYCVGAPMDGSSTKGRMFTAHRKPSPVTGELRRVLAEHRVAVTDDYER